MSKLFGLATAMLMLAGASSALAAGDATKGAGVFQSQCAMCHGVTPGANGIGPSLAGIYGKPAASMAAGYEYSAALKGAKLVWDDASLDKFLAAPQSYVPGTKMPYAGLPDAGDRADVIAYLATLTGK
ncbi:MAG: c-type cytochrome [Acidocella sp.]|nr:c-type cytochrome [Acidocella sp.]